jgi:site-specific DNA-cytosine methylase
LGKRGVEVYIHLRPVTFFADSNNPDQLRTFHDKLYATLFARTGRAADGESMNLGASKFNTLSNIVFGNKNKFGTVLRAPLTVASTCYIVSLFLHRPDGVSEEDVLSEARLLRTPDVAASIQGSLDQNKTIEAIALERKVKGASTSKTTKNSSGNDQPADSDESRSARTVSKAKDKDKSPPARSRRRSKNKSSRSKSTAASSDTKERTENRKRKQPSEPSLTQRTALKPFLDGNDKVINDPVGCKLELTPDALASLKRVSKNEMAVNKMAGTSCIISCCCVVVTQVVQCLRC